MYIKGNRTFMCVLLLLQRSDSCAEWRVETELLRSHRLRRQLTIQHLLPSHPKVGYNILCVASLLSFISFPQSLIPKSLSFCNFPPPPPKKTPSCFMRYLLIKTIKALILRKLSNSKMTYLLQWKKKS